MSKASTASGIGVVSAEASGFPRRTCSKCVPARFDKVGGMELEFLLSQLCGHCSCSFDRWLHVFLDGLARKNLLLVQKKALLRHVVVTKPGTS